MDIKVSGNYGIGGDYLYVGGSGAWMTAGDHTYRFWPLLREAPLDGTSLYDLRVTVEPATELLDWGFRLAPVNPLPEPSTFILLGLGGLGLLGWRHRRRPS